MKRLFKGLILCILCLPLMVKAVDFDSIFNKISTDDIVLINAIESNDSATNAALINAALLNKLGSGLDYFVETDYCFWVYDPINDTYTCNMVEPDAYGYQQITVYVTAYYGEPDEDGNRQNETDSKVFKIKFNGKLNDSIVTKVNEVATKIKDKTFAVSDMGYIAFINKIPEGYNETGYINYALPYSSELLELAGNHNITFRSDVRMGDSEPWNQNALGYTTLFYNGVGVNMSEPSGPAIRNIVYVPNDTEDTDEAYIAAVLKRIKDYLGPNNGITITRKGSLIDKVDSDACNNYPFVEYECIPSNSFNDLYNGRTGKLDSIYEVTTKVGNKYYILIEKDSSKMKYPKLNLSDIDTNINISTDDGNIPLDTTFKATYVTEGDEYNKIKDKIKGNFTAVDLDLFSNVTKANVTKTENGKFKVSIPVPENLNGKKIYVYYITSTGELEEHEATVENGYATFETDHFSTYILAEKQTDNPKTGDYIINYVILLSIAVIGVFITKKEVNE